MTIKEMLAKGMTREQVERELVRLNVVTSLGDAREMVSFALGETTGDLHNAQVQDPEYFIRRLVRA